MKVKDRTLIMLAILYCTAYECKWFTILGLSSPIWINIERFLFIALFVYCRFRKRIHNKIKIYTNTIDKGAIIVLGVGFVEFIYSVAFQGIALSDVINNSIYSYLRLLAVYPIIYLLHEYGTKKTIIVIVLVTGISVAYQWLVAAFYNSKGVIINQALITNLEWVRNGNIRIASTCLTWVLLLIFFGITLQKKTIIKRLIPFVFAILILLFMILVNQSRALYVSAIVSILMMYLFHSRRSNTQIGAVVTLAIFMLAFSQTSVFNSFVSSFSFGTRTDTLTGRLMILGYAMKDISNHSLLFGYGFIGHTYTYGIYTLYFIDYGIVGDLLQLGVFALVQYIVFLAQLGRNIRLINDVKGFGYDISVGTIVFLIVGGLGFSVLAPSRNYAIPIVLAISQYYAVAGKKKGL